MELNRQFHAPAALPPGKGSLAEWDGDENRSGLFGDERDILPVPKIEPCFPRQDHVPMSTELWEIKRDSVGN
jgi:hypothetical protein